MSDDMIQKGEWFADADGTHWHIVDPWLPVESTDEIVGTVWIKQANGASRWITAGRFERLVGDGVFTPIATDGGERPPDCDCQDEIGERPCSQCFAAGFDIPASKEGER